MCVCVCVCACVLSRFSCVQLCETMDCSPPGSSVYDILQARILLYICNKNKFHKKSKNLTYICGFDQLHSGNKGK